MAESVKDNIDIEASVADIFTVATDLAAYPEWNANIKKVEITETDDQGRPAKAYFEVDLKLKQVSYTLGYDYSGAPESFSWELIEGDVNELSGSYSFDGFDDVTEVTYEMKADPGFKIPSMLRRQVEKAVVKGALEDLKKRVEN